MRRRALLAGGVAAGAMGGTIGWAQPADPIQALCDQVSPRALRETVFGLSAFPSRWTNHPDFPAVEAWMTQAMQATGASVRRLPFAMPSGKTRHNIVAGPAPSDRPIILIGAHYDSISEVPDRAAPGANDNASGVAAMVEVLRILAPLDLPHDILCAAFGAEEQGLYGSTALADLATREGWPVSLVLNLDMLGHRPAQPDAPIVIEYDQGNAVPGNDAAAEAVGQRAAALAARYTGLATRHTDIWSSDYMPFEAHGFPAIGLYDGSADAPGSFYHSAQDTADRLDYRRLTQATRLAVAIVADAAGVGGGGGLR